MLMAKCCKFEPISPIISLFLFFCWLFSAIWWKNPVETVLSFCRENDSWAYKGRIWLRSPFPLGYICLSFFL